MHAKEKPPVGKTRGSDGYKATMLPDQVLAVLSFSLYLAFEV